MQAKDASDLNSWKSQVSSQLNHLIQDNAVLRSEFKLFIITRHMNSRANSNLVTCVNSEYL